MVHLACKWNFSGAECEVWANPDDAITSVNSYNTISECCKVTSATCAQVCCHRTLMLHRSVFEWLLGLFHHGWTLSILRKKDNLSSSFSRNQTTGRVVISKYVTKQDKNDHDLHFFTFISLYLPLSCLYPPVFISTFSISSHLYFLVNDPCVFPDWQQVSVNICQGLPQE